MFLFRALAFVALFCLAAVPVAMADPPESPEDPAAQVASMIEQALRGTELRLPDDSAASPGEVGLTLLDGLTARQREVHSIAWPIMATAAHAKLCKPHGRTGILLSAFDFQLPAGHARIDSVAAGSPAAAAGIQRGDLLSQINGKRVRKAERAAQQLDDASSGVSMVDVVLVREGAEVRLSVATSPSCDLTISVFDQAGGFSPGQSGSVQIDGRLFASASDSTEKQIVVAHHLAHHLAGHVSVRSALSTAGGILDRVAAFGGFTTFGLGSAAGAAITRPGDETEADAVSIALLASQGVGAQSILAFWEQVSDNSHPLHKFMDAHPVTEARAGKLRALAGDVVTGPSVAHDPGP